MWIDCVKKREGYFDYLLPSAPRLASVGQDNGRDRDQRLEIRNQDDGDGGLSDMRIVAETADLASSDA